VLIAGDIYDKSMPTVEAVQLLDRFLVGLHALNIAVFIISGNHDSAERMAFGAELFKKSGVHIVQSYNGTLHPVTVTDNFGDIQVWMLPHLRPSTVRRYFADSDMTTYSDAVSAALSNAPVNTAARNILIAHQFVTGAVISDSEERMVGGSENVDAAIFDAFDYVALGHMHRPQTVKRETLRYCGTPLMYSITEANHQKSVTLVEMGAKGRIIISELPLTPKRLMREIRGTYSELMNRENYKNTHTDDFVHIILTDEQEEPDAMAKLRVIYPHILRLEYDNKRTQAAYSLQTTVHQTNRSALFGTFFEMQNGKPMNDEQLHYVDTSFAEILRQSAG
jgi:exonuclease SbcD